MCYCFILCNILCLSLTHHCRQLLRQPLLLQDWLPQSAEHSDTQHSHPKEGRDGDSENTVVSPFLSTPSHNTPGMNESEAMFLYNSRKRRETNTSSNNRSSGATWHSENVAEAFSPCRSPSMTNKRTLGPRFVAMI